MRTGDFYEVETLSFIRKILPPAATIVDVGANIGNHAIYFDRVCKARKVFTIEPNDDVIRDLIANTAANDCKAVDLSLIGFAVGAESGVVQLDLSPSDDAIRNRGGVSVVTSNGRLGQTVPIRRLDDLDLGDVDFLKIDVEGNGLAVLAGASGLLQRCRPLMLIEVDLVDLPAFTVWMQDAGYEMNGVIEHHMGVLNVMLSPLPEIGEGTSRPTRAPERTSAGESAKQWIALDAEKRRADRAEDTLAIAIATMRNSDARALRADTLLADAEYRAAQSEKEVASLRVQETLAALEAAKVAQEPLIAKSEIPLAPEMSFWRSVFFRRNGRPKKALRRALFHTSGRPRGVFKKYVLRLDGTPRNAFEQWMTSTEYLSMPDSVRRYRSNYSMSALPVAQPRLQQNPRLRRDGKKVLFVDAVLPDPNRDSGSVDTINYVTWLRRLGYEVHFLSTSYERGNTLKDPAQAAGAIVLEIKNERDATEFLRDKGADFDVFFLSRVHSGGRLFEACRHANPAAHVIFNTVDLHFLREEREARLHRDNAALFRSAAVRDREIYIARQSDLTIVVSHAEQDILQAEVPGTTVAVMPLYRPLSAKVNAFEGRKGVGFIGGFAHTPNVDAVKYFLSEIWPLVQDLDPSVRFEIAGPSLPSEIAGSLPEGVVYKGQVPDLEDWLGNLRVTVAPLRFGAGAKGKVASSIVNGVPVIGTSVAFEGMGIGSDAAVAVDSAALMAQEIVRVHNDPEAWTVLSHGARAFGHANLSPEAGQKRFQGLLANLPD